MAKWVVATVLKTGGDFLPEHVLALKAQVDRHFQPDHQFVCLTDTYVPGVERVLLSEYWPGWWSKLELFTLHERFDAPLFYLDLDTVLTGPVNPPEPKPNEMWMLRDFLAWDNETFKSRRWATGLMAWHGNYRWIFELAKAEGVEKLFRYYKWDQIFVYKATEQAREGGSLAFEAIDGVMPVQSYKKHELNRETPDTNAIVCFHGKPRPWEVQTPWVKEGMAWHE